MTGARERVFDAGLQAERTALAWQRTALALAVAALAAGRLLAPTLGLVAVVPAALGLVQAVVAGLAARRRYRAVHRSLSTRGDLAAVAAGAAPIAAVAAGGVVTALLALAFVLTSRY